MNGLARFWTAVGGHVEARAEPRRTRRVLTIASIARDSTGAAITARGTIGGAGDFSVDVRGKGVREGMQIGVTGPANDPYAPLAFADIAQSDDPTAAYGDVNADLPVPTFASTPFTTAIVKSPGSVTARGSVFFNAVAERYSPSYYLLTWRLTSGPGEWQDLKVPHLGGVQECNLGSAFAPGVQIDVKLRAHYDWALSFSVASAVSTFTLASDTASPGSATGLAVDATIAGQLLLTPAGTLDASLFDHWQYEFNTTGSGAATDTRSDRGQLVYRATAGTYYARVVPVSKSGTVGTYYPGPSSWSGPFTITPASAPLDTTPPADWSAPSVALTRVTPDTGGEYARLTVTLPARGGGYESDYATTIVRAVNGSLFLERVLQYNGVAHDPQVFDAVAFGTWDVTLQAVDTSGNRSGVSTAGSDTLASSGVPGAASAPTVTQRGLALLVSWTIPANALGVFVQRADDAAFTTGVVTFGPFYGTAYLDYVGSNAAIALPTYYYRIKGSNLAGDGAYSTGATGTVLALHGSFLVADSITALEIAAGTITGTEFNASIVLASLFKTAASGTRWELEGHTGGGNQDQLRAYEAVSGVDKLRLMLDGTGLYLYNDDASVAGKFYRDGTTGKTSMWLNGVRMYGAASGLGATEVRLDLATLNFIGPSTNTWKFKEVETVGGAYTLGLIIPASYSDYFVLGAEPNTGTGIKNGMVFYVTGSASYIGWLNGSSSTPDIILKRDTAARLRVEGGYLLSDSGFYAGAVPIYVTAYPIATKQETTLGANSGDNQPLEAWQYPSANTLTLRLRAYRGANTTQPTDGWKEARFRFAGDVDNYGADLSYLDIGAKGFAPFIALGTVGGGAKFWWDDGASKWWAVGALDVSGALTKGSGTFRIPHPDPAKTATHDLRHSFFESADRGGTLLRLFITLLPDDGGAMVEDSEGRRYAALSSHGRVIVTLPDWWRWLNERPQVLTSPYRHFGQSWGEVADDGATLTLHCQQPGAYHALVIATRKDPVAVAGWDETGGLEPPRQQRETP